MSRADLIESQIDPIGLDTNRSQDYRDSDQPSVYNGHVLVDSSQICLTFARLSQVGQH